MVKKKDLKVSEVAKLLGLSANTVYKMIRSGVIGAYRLGGQWRVTHEALEKIRGGKDN